MHRRASLASALALTGLLAACSSASGTPTPSTSGSPMASEQASMRVEVSLNDALRMEPGTMRVRAGVPVTFVVTNTGAIDHEFFLGDESAQAAHETEMAAMGGMTHDDPQGIGVSPGETKELTYTFAQPGATLAGCHLPGHYAAGMKAGIAVQD